MTCPACHKSDRALYYCHRGDCPRFPGSRVEIPPPEVEVTTNDEGKTHVVVSRTSSDGSPRGRSYEIGGATPNEKIQDAVRKVLADPYSAEWVPRR